ncbi:hypothetical protein CBP51_02730 [Cellvibrio mixtus]|uniref:Guanylate cyclase domain-containing protein n=2 Tax=Cellvibrio mixtus TaxID=39650 RepID=A0A266Q7U9_9GAMM|nr:hypothetical protein CBP51_02730 [Cellvibrio mixtus]
MQGGGFAEQPAENICEGIMENEHNYKERYVAFIDILGFKEAVYESPENAAKFHEIAIALEHLSKVKHIIHTTIEDLKKSDEIANQAWAMWQDVKVTTFSDNIFISAENNNVGLMALGAYSCLIYNTLFANGFFARGGITKGELFESDDVVFGKALIDAYELESKTSIFPRILIANSIIDEIKKTTGFHIEQDFDGSYFLDVFYPGINKLKENWQKSTGLKLDLQKGKLKLSEELQKTKNQSVRSKLFWLAKYFNAKTENHKITPIENI